MFRRMVCAMLMGLGALVAGLAAEDKETAKEKAAMKQNKNNLHELALAMHDYHQVNGHFPPAVLEDKDKKPLLSWRVLLLPYLDEDELFKQFHLDEPWDSKHNKPLLAKMPKLYAPPLQGKTKVEHGTFYQVFMGKGTIFEGAEGKRITDIFDGTSNTILIVEAAEAVPWTKPADLPYDDKKPLPNLGGLFRKRFQAAFADGSVRWLKKDFEEEQMHRIILRSDGQVVDFSKLSAEK